MSRKISQVNYSKGLGEIVPCWNHQYIHCARNWTESTQEHRELPFTGLPTDQEKASLGCSCADQWRDQQEFVGGAFRGMDVNTKNQGVPAN